MGPLCCLPALCRGFSGQEGAHHNLRCIYSPWGQKESDVPVQLSMHLSQKPSASKHRKQNISLCVYVACVCVCVCWEVVYRVCLKQTRQWAFDCVGVGVTPCRPRAPSPGWSAVTVSLQAMHRAHLFLCCWLHSTTPSVISSCGLAG